MARISERVMRSETTSVSASAAGDEDDVALFIKLFGGSPQIAILKSPNKAGQIQRKSSFSGQYSSATRAKFRNPL